MTATPRPTTSSASFSVRRAICLPRSPSSSAQSRFDPNPPTPTTTSAWRCGTAATRPRRSPSCRRARGSIRRPAPATRFSGLALRENGDFASARVRACSARLPSGRQPPPSTWTSASRFFAAGEPAKALGQLEAALNTPAAVASRARLGWRHRRSSSVADRGCRRTRRRTTSSAGCSVKRAPTAATSPRNSARRFGFVRTTPKPTTISASC